ncbi:MAG: hypothetical protein ACPGSB_05945, partial [Opitutales bacterium]
MDIKFANNIELKDLPVETDRYALLEAHSRVHAQALDEVPVLGFIGPAAFNSNVIELDMSEAVLRAMSTASDEAYASEMPYQIMSCGIVVDATGPAGRPVKAAVTTRHQDSALAPDLLEVAREAAVKPNTFQIGDVNWGERSAVRFEPLDPNWPLAVNGRIGMDALKNSILTLWPEREMIALRAKALPSPFPEAEQAYFLAFADQDAQGVAEYIDTGGRQRLIDEACLELWSIRRENNESSIDEQKSALDIIAENYTPERRTEVILLLTDRLERSLRLHKDELIAHALELAIREASRSSKFTAVHDVHLEIGRRALASGDIRKARRHLLSAAFGMPKNAECNFWLGEVYRETGRLRRAWSRYFQALLDEQLKPDDPLRFQALERLETLNRDPEFRKDFDMIDAEQYMAGRLADSEFYAETRYRFMRMHKPHHARMAELFVDSSEATGGGMELAFHALEQFFENELVLLSWHLDDPLHSEASRKRIDTYANPSVPMVVIDGTTKFDTVFGDGRKPGIDAARHYPLLREACLPENAPEASTWQIAGEIELDGEQIQLEVS